MPHERHQIELNSRSLGTTETGAIHLHPGHVGLRALLASIHLEPLDEQDRDILDQVTPGFAEEYDELHVQHTPRPNALRIVDAD